MKIDINSQELGYILIHLAHYIEDHKYNPKTDDMHAFYRNTERLYNKLNKFSKGILS